MTYPVAHTITAGPLRIPVNWSGCLVFAVLAPLILNPLFGPRAALVFLFFGGLLIIAQLGYSFNALVKYRILMIYPAYCGLTTMWSQYPSVTLRYSIQLAITFAVSIIIATRVAPGVLLRCLYAIYSIGIGGSILFGRVRDDNGAWVGIFGSKNAFAAIVTGFALTSLALLLDKSASKSLRLIALGSAVLAIPLLIAGQSTGSVVFMVPASLAVVSVLISRHMSHAQKLTVVIAVAFTVAGTSLVLYGYGDELLSAFLDASGKDVTLTGRTDLWDVGFDLISQRPLFGLGYQAFWVQEFAPAEELWAMFGITARSGFNFHNTYVSNAVELGMVGVALQAILIYGTFIGLLRWALTFPPAENAYLVGFMTLLSGTSFLEVGVYFQFSITTVVAICATVYALRYQEWRNAQSTFALDQKVYA